MSAGRNRQAQATRAVVLFFDETNECVMLESQILRRRSVIEDAESTVELSMSIEFCDYDDRTGRNCR